MFGKIPICVFPGIAKGYLLFFVGGEKGANRSWKVLLGIFWKGFGVIGGPWGQGALRDFLGGFWS